MRSIQKFDGRRVYLTLGTGALQISRATGVFAIPLAAIAEVRVSAQDARDMEIVLTDGEMHHIEGVGPASTADFVTRLGNALPEQRDPSGSALIIKPPTAPEGVPWSRLTVLALIVLACTAYAIWAGVNHGTRVIGVVAGLFVLLIGLATCAMAVDKVALRVRLARHGVTVDAERVGRSGSGPLYYYNDAAGVPHQYSGGSGAPTIPVTYDPSRPDQALHKTRLAVAVNTTLTLTAAGLLLLLGAWLSFGLL